MFQWLSRRIESVSKLGRRLHLNCKVSVPAQLAVSIKLCTMLLVVTGSLYSIMQQSALLAAFVAVYLPHLYLDRNRYVCLNIKCICIWQILGSNLRFGYRVSRHRDFLQYPQSPIQLRAPEILRASLNKLDKARRILFLQRSIAQHLVESIHALAQTFGRFLGLLFFISLLLLFN
jgi:hypothetical protein